MKYPPSEHAALKADKDKRKAEGKARHKKNDRSGGAGGTLPSPSSSNTNGSDKKVLKLSDRMKAALLAETKMSDEEYNKMISMYNQSN